MCIPYCPAIRKDSFNIAHTYNIRNIFNNISEEECFQLLNNCKLMEMGEMAYIGEDLCLAVDCDSLMVMTMRLHHLFRPNLV